MDAEYATLAEPRRFPVIIDVGSETASLRPSSSLPFQVPFQLGLKMVLPQSVTWYTSPFSAVSARLVFVT